MYNEFQYKIILKLVERNIENVKKHKSCNILSFTCP